MHTQNQPIDQCLARHSSKAGATRGQEGGTQTRRARCSRDTTPAPDQGASAHSTTALSSAPRYCNTPRPLAVWEGKEGERAAGPRILTSRTPLRPLPSATSPVGLQALSCPKARLGRKAARVPPCVRRGTGLDGSREDPTPRWKGWAFEACWPRPRRFSPGSSCVLGCRPPEHEQKI